ncbi:Cytokinin riboside 5'-monophosphate phosphoribohydrolase LOG protein [Dioscorea alata]|uniref:Cytokinin riboside 5'-monophosphate phosphoribohydrolase LOG protein n=1 Tax=Dioscorea alata TaxID=55571 RepID=A0ACB7UL54_DIOAL|nr:Cytokinin riboside 5'-monophosphate phosphoribohydrolase LOG protein [Dioscorea alata]
MEEEKKSTVSKFKTICIFYGSSVGKKKSYQIAAINLGKELVLKNIDLVYRGGSIRLMGLISQTVFNGGRNVIGGIPKALMGREITSVTVGEIKPVIGMHHRKAEIDNYVDAFIALLGYGTLEELFEVISWVQLGIHNKPVILSQCSIYAHEIIKRRYITYALFHIGLLNVDGYYNSLLSFIDKVLEEEFINLAARQIIISSSNAKELIEKLEEYFSYIHLPKSHL